MEFVFDTETKGARVSFVEGETTRFTESADGLVLSIGVKKLADIGVRELRTLVRKAIRLAREQKLLEISIQVSAFRFENTKNISNKELGRLLGENMVMANYEFERYKSKKPEYAGVRTVYLADADAEVEQGVREGKIIADEINACRDLANTPGGDMTPGILAEAAREWAKDTDIKVSVLHAEEIKNLGMGLVLGVARGSSENPEFVVMEYMGGDKGEKPIVLVGKGVTFDSGGINIKTGDHMLGMHHDMAGGASVMCAVAIAAKLKLKKNVVALVPAVENMPSGHATRPGDVLTSMSGKTVEVLNTDAEGRLILADALTYAERYQPRLVLDVATLTGAALIALGTRASAIMTRDEKLETKLRELGEKSGEYVWPFPLWKEYETDAKGRVGDIANISTGKNSRDAGVIMGGIFLQEFAKAYTWAHIDMAPRMESTPEDNLARGAAGAPVRLLVRVIEEY